MTKMNGGTMMTRNSAIVKVSRVRLTLKVHNRIKMILRTLLVLKVSWMTMKKMSGKVMTIKMSIEKVSP